MTDTFKGIITADGKKRQLPYGNVLETPVSDETLSIPGAFADAKTVGNKFAKVNETTDSLKKDLLKLNNKIFVIPTEEKKKISTSSFNIMDGYVIGSDGKPSVNGTYILFYKTFDHDAKVWFEVDDKALFSAFLASSTYKDGIYTPRKRYIKNSEDYLPNQLEPYEFKTGTTLYISCTKAAYTSYGYPSFHELSYNENNVLNENVILNDTQIEQVNAKIVSKKCKFIYEQKSTIESSNEQLTVFIPTKSGYTKYQFVHSIDTSKNADNWRMGLAYAVDDNFGNEVALTSSGEWECAVRLKGRNDFSGGIAHGDEAFTSLRVVVDGVFRDISSITELTEFDELRIIETANLYDPSNNTSIIAVHGSEHIFNRNGLKINQTVIWETNVTVTVCYLAMFPVSKSVTDALYTDKDYQQKSIVAGKQLTSTFAKRCTIYSDSEKFMADFNIGDYPSGYNNGDYFICLDNGGSRYNKCYYAITNTSGTVDYEIASGTEWKSETFYNLNYHG